MLIGLKEPKKELKLIDVQTLELDDMQKYVGGYIEIVNLPNINFEVKTFLNEEGKILGLEPNLRLNYEALVGNILFVKLEMNDENDDEKLLSLTDSDILQINDYIKKNEIK